MTIRLKLFGTVIFTGALALALALPAVFAALIPVIRAAAK